ncbi:MAG TPA: M23 family metallopeptidase [Kofleriaceae bacterium]
MATAACPRCARFVGLHEGRPFITAAGEIELWHRLCDEARHLPTLADPVFVSPPRPSRQKHWLIGAAAAAALVVIAISQWTWAVTREAPRVALPNVDSPTHEPLSLSITQVAPTIPAKPERTIWDEHVVPTHASGQSIDQVFPTLRGWLHPIVNAEELISTRSQRHFGAERVGIERAECGRGHCGVDLHGMRGDPIIAVAAGVVVKVERREDGGDGMSGRYVRIRHADDAFTAYMHLDSIEKKLEVGDTVSAGQYLGTLGSSGVSASAPHLHFALELAKKPDPTARHHDTRFVDPAPFLVRSKVAAKAVRIHAVKPAF